MNDIRNISSMDIHLHYKSFMKTILQILILLIIVSCQLNSDKKNDSISVKNKVSNVIGSTQPKKIEQQISKKKEIPFDTITIFSEDTLIRDYQIKTRQISSQEYEDLYNFRVLTDFEKDNPDDHLIKSNSCYIIKYYSNKLDTLCDFDDGEYYEKYKYRGFSKKTNTLMFDWENWEESHPILINLKCDKYWILRPGIEVSPKRNRLIVYGNFIDDPLYEANEFFIYELSKDSVRLNYSFSNTDYGVFDTKWIGLDKVLILIRKIDNENYEAKESYHFEMKIKNAL